MKIKYPQPSQSGNVLFLILIAVALFAALSYAVSTSMRSGGGDASRETTAMLASQIVQFPAGVRAGVNRMMLSNGIAASDLLFNAAEHHPNGWAHFAPPNATKPRLVFHPEGGGVIYEPIPRGAIGGVAYANAAYWMTTSSHQVYNVGSTSNAEAPTSSSADIVLITLDITRAICQKINETLGLGSTIPDESFANQQYMGMAHEGIDATGGTIGNTSGSILNGQPQGCYRDTSGGLGAYVFYSVIVER